MASVDQVPPSGVPPPDDPARRTDFSKLQNFQAGLIGDDEKHDRLRGDEEEYERSQGSSQASAPHDSEDDRSERKMVTFAPNDPSNPYCWSRSKKLFCVTTSILLVMNSTIGSSIGSGGTVVTARRFGLKPESELLVLPVSTYLIGYIIGPIVFPPLSESYGRKGVMIATFALFTAFVLGCALAPTFAGLVVMRLLVGIGASTPISVIGGIFADLYNTPKARGLAMTGFMAATTWGPLVGPIIAGYVAPISWQWVYWTELIIAGATWPLLLFMPETFGPVILQRKAAKLRKDTGNDNFVAPADLQVRDMRELFVKVLTRPIRMFLFEAIVLFTCLYLALLYGIFYIFFQAFPIVFEGIYHFNDGEVGLAFLPIGIGSIIATGMYLWWDWYLERAKAQPNPPKWSSKEEFLRLPLACLGGPFLAVSLFWLGWTARSSIPWIVPVLGVIPFGIGFLLCFMSLINYIVDAYEIYAASAMGAASASRSIFGVILPFAARPMYQRLGVAWSCTLLGILTAMMSVIPFVFIKFGPRIRANSKFCQELLRRKDDARQRETGDAEIKTDDSKHMHHDARDVEKLA